MGVYLCIVPTTSVEHMKRSVRGWLRGANSETIDSKLRIAVHTRTRGVRAPPRATLTSELSASFSLTYCATARRISSGLRGSRVMAYDTVQGAQCGCASFKPCHIGPNRLGGRGISEGGRLPLYLRGGGSGSDTSPNIHLDGMNKAVAVPRHGEELQRRVVLGEQPRPG